MNKKFIKVAFVAAIAMISGVNVFNAQKVNTLSEITLANVEALADGEWYDGNCFWSDWQFTLCYEYGPVPLGCPCGAIGNDLL